MTLLATGVEGGSSTATTDAPYGCFKIVALLRIIERTSIYRLAFDSSDSDDARRLALGGVPTRKRGRGRPLGSYIAFTAALPNPYQKLRLCPRFMAIVFSVSSTLEVHCSARDYKTPRHA